LASAYELYFVGRYKEVQATLQKAQELNPHLSSLHFSRGKILFSQGCEQEALAEMEKKTGEWEKRFGGIFNVLCRPHMENRWKI
jgi:tetratricopeptide (TPR) repeat protein